MSNHIREMTVTIGNGKKLFILHVYAKSFACTIKTFQLNKVFHVPHLTTNLISVSKFYIHNNTFFEFHSHVFLVKDLVM